MSHRNQTNVLFHRSFMWKFQFRAMGWSGPRLFWKLTKLPKHHRTRKSHPLIGWALRSLDLHPSSRWVSVMRLQSKPDWKGIRDKRLCLWPGAGFVNTVIGMGNMLPILLSCWHHEPTQMPLGMESTRGTALTVDESATNSIVIKSDILGI